MTKPIRVVDILTDRELALSGGAEQGLEVGDVLRILPGKPRAVVDPETGDVLGEIVQTKAVVRVYEVQDRFCLARTFRTRQVNVGGGGIGSTSAIFGRIFEPPKYEVRVETLRKDPSLGTVIDPSESIVEVGDIAEKVEGEDVNDLPTNTLFR